MKDSILITGGHVVDPVRGIDGKGDILIVGDRIVDTSKTEAASAETVVRADGCLVMPGLIDFHAHVFWGGTDAGIAPDVGLLPNCVTTVVDGGSAGTANYEVFHKSVIANSFVRIKSFLNVSPTGIATNKYDEATDPQYYDEEKIESLFRQYGNELLGLKIRQSKEIVKEHGLEPLKKALQIAGRVPCRVAVHTTNPPGSTGELIDLLRSGDIFVHVYHGKGSTIIGGDNRVLPRVKAAKECGVIFDAANGKNHFAFSTAEGALADGFKPDVISSDLSWLTFLKQPVFALPWVMAKYLALGMDLVDIVAACTSTPARLMGMAGEIGTLSPGACADVAIMKLINHQCEFLDAVGERRMGQGLLLPQATIRAGRLVFRQLTF
jgi:predicted amidohydrolase